MKIGRGIGAVASLALAGACFAQGSATYPTRPVRMVVSFPPGGGADLTARTVAQKLTESFGQPVVVDNRPGANGLLGTDIVAKSDPDGYTILLTDRGALGINPSLYKKLPYDPLKDLAYIGIACTGSYVLAINSKLPATTFQEFIALAKAKPGLLLNGSPGQGTSPHLSAELFKIMTGIKLDHVQFKGAGMAIVSLLSGEVSVMFTTPPTAMAYLKAGRLRPLGLTTLTRIEALPDVPTIAEAGVPGYESVQWFGMLVPAGTPRPIIDRLHQEIARSLRAPDMKGRLTSLGLTAVGSTPEEFGAYMRSETEKWAKVIKTMGIKPE
jgi:tripartite-type tricarboxylate transporter receptor subunit TctC